jgi:hypothetical protein
MGRAIAILTIIVLCSFGFVGLQLWFRRAASPPAPSGPAPLLENMDDGSLYAVGLRLSRFEERLMASEKRDGKLAEDLDASRQENDALRRQIDDLQAEVRRLRRQVAERPRPVAPANAPVAPPANAPAPAPVTPVPPAGGAAGNG